MRKHLELTRYIFLVQKYLSLPLYYILKYELSFLRSVIVVSVSKKKNQRLYSSTISPWKRTWPNEHIFNAVDAYSLFPYCVRLERGSNLPLTSFLRGDCNVTTEKMSILSLFFFSPFLKVKSITLFWPQDYEIS